jgi:multicomponent K+:H+ antiporter subunit A
MLMLAGLVDVATAAVTGAPRHIHLALWHGVASPAMWMSVAAFGGGFMLLGLHPRLARWQLPLPDGKRVFDGVMAAAVDAARRFSETLHDGAFTRFAAIAIVAIVAACLYAFTGGSHSPGTRSATVIEFAPALAWAVMMAAMAGAVVLHRNRVLALLLLGVVGLILSAGFAYLSAPDLALTQIAVEVVTIVLMLLGLNFLPKTTPSESGALRRMRDGAVAAIAGIGAAALAYALMLRGPAFPPISGFHLAQSLPGAGGSNAVNTIIVDFRGFDTYGEIIVLGIAALIIFALVEGLLSPGAANDRLLATKPHIDDAGDRHPMIFVVATRILMPFAMLVGVYIYLRGHNLPGGGFVAGLVFAIALVLQYLASGHGWTAKRQRVPYHGLIGAGVLVATATGLGSMAFGRPFLTSYFTHVHLPPLEDFELATAALFDLGVFLSVLGAVMLVLASLSRIGQRAGEIASDAPYDGGPR